MPNGIARIINVCVCVGGGHLIKEVVKKKCIINEADNSYENKAETKREY